MCIRDSNSDLTVDLSNNSVEILDNHSENWKVTMVDTGLNTQTEMCIRDRIPITQITVRNAIRVGLQEIPFFVHTFQPVDEFMFCLLYTSRCV